MTEIAAIIGIGAFGWLTLFQLFLAAGAPLGRMAWGGANRVLPRRLRVSSAVSALLTFSGALTVAQAGEYVLVLPDGWVTLTLWFFTGIFALSFVANLFGASGIERLHGVPLAILCTASTLALALP